MRYRRSFAPGGTYFFTVNLADRRSRLLVECIEVLREAVRRIQARHPFQIEAMVVLPDHLHAVWTLPDGDSDFPLRWGLIKAAFSRAVERIGSISASRSAKGEREIWQRRFWEHQVRNEVDLARHVDYIHFNPVKHGYAEKPCDWPYSSIHRYIAMGKLTADWGGGEASVPEARERVVPLRIDAIPNDRNERQ